MCPPTPTHTPPLPSQPASITAAAAILSVNASLAHDGGWVSGGWGGGLCGL